MSTSETPPISPADDLDLPKFESMPVRRLGKVNWADWMDEIEPFRLHFEKRARESGGLPRRTPWEGRFEL